MLKLGVIFGGMSTENEVSVVSGKNVLQNLDNTKFEIHPIYIDKDGNWYTYKGEFENLKMQEKPSPIQKIVNEFDYLKSLDVVFPVLHGLYGEDGTVQGLLELLEIPYVGCKVLASSLGMDKVYTKVVFEKAGINQAPSRYIRKFDDKYIYIEDNFDEKILDLKQICEKLEQEFKFPMYIKPSNSGSSVGISKAKTKKELEIAIREAAKYDKKILIEQGIEGKEVECAILGNEEVIAGEVGEIKPADEFYSYDAKYNNENSKTIIPASIPKNIQDEIKKIAIKAFKAIDGKGLARVDFFVENQTNKIYLNEINTMPGFTQISMYPKLMEKAGVTYKELLSNLIELALKE